MRLKAGVYSQKVVVGKTYCLLQHELGGVYDWFDYFCKKEFRGNEKNSESS
jgi:hypothetical protein